MKGLSGLLITVFAMAVLVLAGEPTSGGKLTGVARDSEGAVISNAIVLVHWDTDGSQGARGGAHDDLQLVTSKTGEFRRTWRLGSMTLLYSRMRFHRTLVRCESELAKPQKTM
jgi:hypothetical protein